jgi:type I restriction-modification system DNA methylase subunit
VERLNPFPKDEAERIIAKTVAVLDRYSKLYSQLSHGRFADYSSYMASDGFADEDEFVKPKLFTDFLKEVLGFPTDTFVPEHSRPSGIADFQPTDTLRHRFFFEIKGSDSHDLTSYESQMHQYLNGPFSFGALTNMRDALVYDKTGLVTRRISLLQLYRVAKDRPRDLLDRPEAKIFLDFVAQFRYQTLDRAVKVELIKNAPQADTLPAIDPDELVATIREVVRILSEDARRYARDLEHRLKYRAYDSLRRKLVSELVEIASELDHRRVPLADDNIERYVNAREGSLEQRAFDVFLTRVAYFTMTRFLIARMWEDIGFLEQKLYNGGFARWYKIQQDEIQRVLTDAFAMAGRNYSWLFNESHNYFWYDPPSEEAIIDVLYEFAHYNLGLLDTDVLGTVYEQFVDRIDRKNKGQYYTPREVIRFIWDRVGFTDSDAFFRHEGGERQPVQILDVATGSGGFLVEAAYRLRTRAKYSREDPDDLLGILHSITGGMCGCEISLFAHYITEVNLLIQLTPIIRDIVKACKHLTDNTRMVTLRTVPGDSLALIGSRALFTNNIAVHDRPSETIEHDAKGPTRAELTNSFDFDYVCSNPPYVGEKGHKELFRNTRQNIPYWDKYYQGKMDYLYWFIMLGLAKLRPGGKLGFITTSYWPTADGATKLREYILENALIREIIDFGETRIFEGAPGQHNMVFVLEKCPSYTTENSTRTLMPCTENQIRKQNQRIKVVKVKAVPPAGMQPGKAKAPSSIARVIEHLSGVIDKDSHSDRFVDVFYSSAKQGDLDDGPWDLFLNRKEKQLLGSVEDRTAPITDLCELDCGIFSNADYLSAKYLELIPPSRIRGADISVGDGIFVVDQTLADELAVDDPKGRIVKPTYKNSDIDPYCVNTPDNRSFLLYVDDEFKPGDHPVVMAHLDKYKEALSARLDRYGESYPWWRLHRPHSRAIYESEKLVTSRWGKQNVYAIQGGGFYENSPVYERSCGTCWHYSTLDS